MAGEADERELTCGLRSIYVYGSCVLPRGHTPASDHQNRQGIHFTRAWGRDD